MWFRISTEEVKADEQNITTCVEFSVSHPTFTIRFGFFGIHCEIWYTLFRKLTGCEAVIQLVYQTEFSFVYTVVRNYGEKLLYNLTLLEIILYQITTNAVENIAQNVRQNLLLMCMNSQHLNFDLNAVDHRKHFLRNVYNVILNCYITFVYQLQWITVSLGFENQPLSAVDGMYKQTLCFMCNWILNNTFLVVRWMGDLLQWFWNQRNSASMDGIMQTRYSLGKVSTVLIIWLKL